MLLMQLPAPETFAPLTVSESGSVHVCSTLLAGMLAPTGWMQADTEMDYY